MTGSHQSRRLAPPTSMTSSTSSPNVAARAQTSPTNETAASGPSPSAVSGSTRSSSIPLSLYSRYSIHSKENPPDLTLDDLSNPLHQGLAIIQDTKALQAAELLTCGGDFPNLCDCNLIDVPVVLGRSCEVVVVHSGLFSSSNWVEQQPWPPPHVQVEFKCDSATVRPSPWPSFLSSNMFTSCPINHD